MAATVVSSANITNQLAVTSTYNNLALDGTGKLQLISGTIEVATTSLDEIGDTILLCPVFGLDRVVSFVILNDDLDSNGTPALAADLGIYKNVNPEGTSATTVLATAYATADTTLRAAQTAGVELAFEARNIDKLGVNAVWQDGGETAAHNDKRYIGFKLTAAAATAAAGTISFRAMVVRA